jgi:hypothetical protein
VSPQWYKATYTILTLFSWFFLRLPTTGQTKNRNYYGSCRTVSTVACWMNLANPLPTNWSTNTMEKPLRYYLKYSKKGALIGKQLGVPCGLCDEWWAFILFYLKTKLRLWKARGSRYGKVPDWSQTVWPREKTGYIWVHLFWNITLRWKLNSPQQLCLIE